MSDIPTTYAVRLAPAARQAIDDERDRLLVERGVDAALRWIEMMDTALSILLPGRVRQLRVPPRRPRWRLLFTVHDGSDEAPTVRVHLVRHIARPPLTEWPPDEEI